MKHNLSATYMFGFVAAIGLLIIRIGIKQKRREDVMIGALITGGSLLIYFLEFF